ncbi:MAG TPA: DUF4037 domain-containing protein [Anaerovoracaceae bacterium]|nr:DUF4037 domain-containing protein [Anaerovoracaceae bacterium]
MNGIELSNQYYEDYVKDMIKNSFSSYEDIIAVGIAGNGSECFGYDDEYSRDHDYNIGVCIWLDNETYSKIGEELNEEYNKLPKEVYGIKLGRKSLGYDDKYGVETIEDFFIKTIGSKKLPKTKKEWLRIPEYALANAVNGEIFYDSKGEVLAKRAYLIVGAGSDVRRKKIGAYLSLAGQAGQYNYYRSLKRKDEGAIKVSLFEFTNNIVHAIFWLNNRYCPYYKWRYRALRDLPKLSYLERDLIELLDGGDDKRKVIEEICWEVILELRKQFLTKSDSVYLEDHAYSVADGIIDNELKNMHIMDFGQ